MADYALMLFPIGIIVILFGGAKVAKRGEFWETAWDLDQSRAMQVFAAFMVILHHLSQTITNYRGIDKGPITLWNSFGILFTSIFFFFSGFGLYKSYRKKPGYLKGFLRRRLLTIYIPFQLANILYLIIFWKSKVSSAGDAVSCFFGFTLINSNAWFIVELFFLYIAFYLCFRFSRNERTAIIGLTVFAVLMVTGSLLLGHDHAKLRHWFMGEWWYNTTLIFILGILVAKFESRVKSVMMKGYKFVLPAMVLLLVGWYFLEEYIFGKYGYYQEWNGHPGYGEKFLTLLFQLILCAIFVLLMLQINLKVRYGNRLLLFLGGINYEIFLIHGVFREMLPGGPNGTLPDFWYLTLVYLLSIAAAVIMGWVDRRLIKITTGK
jgi:peptidoglycan/LPS O-acetylase OafA/YrhL